MLDKITQLAKENTDIAILWLYGSRADNSYHADSDYDLAVAFYSFLKSPLDIRLRPEILAIEWQQALQLEENKLSIVDINQINIPLAYEIIQYDKVLCSKDDKRLFLEEKRIHSRMEEMVYCMKRYGN